jgi:hypothetical protein
MKLKPAASADNAGWLAENFSQHSDRKLVAGRWPVPFDVYGTNKKSY